MRKLNLLLLDDDPSIIRLVNLFITNSPLNERLQIVAFTEPVRAVTWLQEHGCDILLSDIEMPELTGLDILQAAKARNAWTQAIFMTAHSSWDRITAAIEAGASDYLLKPINKLELLDLLTQIDSRFRRWQAAVAGTFSKAKEAAY